MNKFVHTDEIEGFQIGVVPNDYLTGPLPRPSPSPASIGSLRDELWDWHFDWLRIWEGINNKSRDEMKYLHVENIRRIANDSFETEITQECIGRSGLLAPGWAFDGPLTDWNNVVLCEGFKHTTGPFAGETGCAGGGILIEADPDHSPPDPNVPGALQNYFDIMKFSTEQDTIINTKDYRIKAIVSLNWKSVLDSKNESPDARTQVISGLLQRWNLLYLYDTGYPLVYFPFRRTLPDPPNPPVIFSRAGDYRDLNAEFVVFPPSGSYGSIDNQVPPHIPSIQQEDAGAKWLDDFEWEYTVHLRARYDGIPSEGMNTNYYPGTVTYRGKRHHDRQTISYVSDGEWRNP